MATKSNLWTERFSTNSTSWRLSGCSGMSASMKTFSTKLESLKCLKLSQGNVDSIKKSSRKVLTWRTLRDKTLEFFSVFYWRTFVCFNHKASGIYLFKAWMLLECFSGVVTKYFWEFFKRIQVLIQIKWCLLSITTQVMIYRCVLSVSIFIHTKLFQYWNCLAVMIWSSIQVHAYNKYLSFQFMLMKLICSALP